MSQSGRPLVIVIVIEGDRRMCLIMRVPSSPNAEESISMLHRNNEETRGELPQGRNHQTRKEKALIQ